MLDTHDAEERTEQATSHKRQELRNQGQVARSADVGVATSVLVTAAIFNYFAADLFTALQDMLRRTLSGQAWQTLDVNRLMSEILALAGAVSGALVPVLALIVVALVAVNVAQVGFLFTSAPLTPSLARLNPVAGLQRIWSLPSVVRLTGSILKLAVVCAITGSFVSHRLPELLQGPELEVAAFGGQLGDWLAALAFQMALGLAALAVLDYGFQLWKFEQDIRMTPQELRDELRQMEGDPDLKRRRTEAHRKLLASQQAQQAAGAQVVIVGAGSLAIAIRYQPGQHEFPVVVAAGQDQLGAQVRQTADTHGIPVVENRSLAQWLFSKARQGWPIPAEAAPQIAEILAYAARLSADRAAAAIAGKPADPVVSRTTS